MGDQSVLGLTLRIHGVNTSWLVSPGLESGDGLMGLWRYYYELISRLKRRPAHGVRDIYQAYHYGIPKNGYIFIFNFQSSNANSSELNFDCLSLFCYRDIMHWAPPRSFCIR